VASESGKTLHLGAGDPIVELVDKWHYGRNDGDTTAEIIVVYAGVQGQPITVKAGQ
jgi:quercetin dioxygenase-like cupin family protein